MNFLRKSLLFLRALQELGVEASIRYARYHLKLRSGFYRLQTPAHRLSGNDWGFKLAKVISPADRTVIEKLIGANRTQLIAHAEEILAGNVRLFGGEPRPLDLIPPLPLRHWTAYHSRLPDGSDIKPVWEVGRFGWATVLARAYWISRDEKHADGFWQLSQNFLEANPPNLGPHWSSAQEIALRVISLAFSYRLVAASSASTPERKTFLAKNLVAHAVRIPATLDYSRAQNNNHLLSEALGLWTAGCLLPDHPESGQWRRLGREMFTEGIEKQVHVDGRYVQHSSNYHRLLLQLGIWASCLAKLEEESLAESVFKKLGMATSWLLNLLDETSGRVPNLGPNDGAYILPLSEQPLEDYRPVLQAASSIFLKSNFLGSGPWNDMSLWLGIEPGRQAGRESSDNPIRIEGKDSWAYLRRTYFFERPGHADQLHLDLWWRGMNVAQDAGSYLYTAEAPWDNALASTRVHNTITIEGLDQMTRAGRFLWLNWAQARMVSAHASNGKLIAACAENNGYANLGIVHRREVSTADGRWTVVDNMLSNKKQKKLPNARLHWLLPNWPYEWEEDELHLNSGNGAITLKIDTSAGNHALYSLMRAGELLHGTGPGDAILGWVSPTYGVKIPALSFCIDVTGPLPFSITSTWILPK